MLIQNTSNMAPAPLAARPSGDGGAAVAAITPSRAESGFDVKAVSPQPVEKNVESQPASPPSAEQLKSVVDGINKVLKQANRSLEFSVDDDAHRQVIKLVDSETGDVIRQFPSDEMLAISRAIGEAQAELMVKQEAGGAKGQAQQGLLLKQEA